MKKSNLTGQPSGIGALVSPRSIAVVGATSTTGKIGNTILRSLIDYGFKGKLYPVNPRAENIFGLKCYPSIKELVEETQSIPESVYVTIPPAGVADCLNECAAAGVGSVTVISSALTVKESPEAEERLVSELRSGGTMLLGPNCLGIHSPESRITFNSGLSQNTGPVAYISQSGSMTEVFLLSMESRGIGTRLAVSTGNEAMLTASDFIDYISTLSGVSVIAAYIEEIRDPERFIEACNKLGSEKIIVVYKAGLTKLGGVAASSHTGAIAGSRDAYFSLFKKANVVLAESYDEMIDLVTLSARTKVPSGKRAAVVSAPGGLCVTLSDALDLHGFNLPAFDAELESRLRQMVPPGVTPRNPLDLTMAATTNLNLYADCITTISRSKGWDIMIIGAPTSYSSHEFVEAMKGIRKRVSAPVAVVWMGDAEGVYNGIKEIGRLGFSVFRSPEAAAASISKLSQRQMRIHKIAKTATPVFNSSPPDGRREGWLNPKAIGALFSSHGIGNYDNVVVNQVEEAIEAGTRLGYPLVAKLSSNQLIHKSEAGGVVLNIADERELKSAMERLRSVAVDKLRLANFGYTVSRQISSGLELAVGGFSALGGMVMMFGLGGTLVELTGMKSFAFCPINKAEADEMVDESGLRPLVEGYRGTRLDGEALTSFLVKLSELLVTEKDILEMDVNPLIANSGGLWPVDVRILRAV